ncbi:MAG: hypothetical protein WAM30_03520 [Candidatus Dormiibacterota bacterium]
MSVPLLLVTGPVGVGKTTVTDEASDLLTAAGVAHACVDIDALTRSFPRPPDDRFNARLGLRNLAGIWRNYRDAGAGRLIVAAVVEDRAGIDGYRAAVPGADVTVVRLRAPVAVLQRRLRRRMAGSGLGWHLARALELAHQMDEAALEDHLVEAGQASAIEVARRVLVAAGWPQPAAPEGTTTA